MIKQSILYPVRQDLEWESGNDWVWQFFQGHWNHLSFLEVNLTCILLNQEFVRGTTVPIHDIILSFCEFIDLQKSKEPPQTAIVINIPWLDSHASYTLSHFTHAAVLCSKRCHIPSTVRDHCGFTVSPNPASVNMRKGENKLPNAKPFSLLPSRESLS